MIALQKLFRIPFFFFFMAACLGLFLRYLIVFPIEGVNFTYILHGHSHIMFLGWVFNVLFLAFVSEFTDGKRYVTIFWTLQVLVVGMLIAFPIQGYGLLSIVFSGLHTLVAFAFIVLFFRSTQGATTVAVLLARIALLFFVLSSIGPYYLGYLKANHLDQSNLYRFSIYFYLHFQYNGFFFFGILSLLVKLLESGSNAAHHLILKYGCLILATACLPAYCLSLLWAKPGIAFNIAGFSGALLQIVGAGLICIPIRQWWRLHKPTLPALTSFLYRLAFYALVLKLVLQLLSANSLIASFANEYRPVVIAYLHLVLIGVVTLFLLGWLIQKHVLKKGMMLAVWIFLSGFVISQWLILISPWAGSLPIISIRSFHIVLFFFSFLMAGGVGLMLRSAWVNRS